MSRYLVQYMPLCMNRRGIQAIKVYDYKPFIDHSIRREPSFENPYPGISSLCRGKNFAPRLNVKDEIAYITKPGRYAPLNVDHYRLVAILRVIAKFRNHESAADWYTTNGLNVPTNCIIVGNPPLEHDHSAISINEAKNAEVIYNHRATENSVFLICNPIKIELENPPIILKKDLFHTTGFTPEGLRALQNPKTDNISVSHLNLLKSLF